MSDCKCGHFIQAHMHNFTGEMFGSTIAHCAFCPCQNYEPCAGAEDSVEEPEKGESE